MTGICVFSFKINNKKYNISLKNGEKYNLNGINLQYTENGSIVDLSCVTDNPLKDPALAVIFDYKPVDSDRILLNGYQSWTESNIVSPNYAQKGINPFFRPILNRYRLYSYGDYNFYKYSGRKGRFHSYTFTAFTNGSDEWQFLGSLTDELQYTCFDYDTVKGHIIIKPETLGLTLAGGRLNFKMLMKTAKFDELSRIYSEAQEGNRTIGRLTTGWTSWYNYYTDITPQIISDNIQAIVEGGSKPEYFQIDDGYQAAVGDWLETNNKFPGSMKSVVSQIKNAGMKAGLWLAPFVCEKKSSIFTNKYHWIMKDKRGKPVIAGNSALWSGDFYALDIYNDEVRSYLKEVFNLVVEEWGFDLVKLDFLYAIAIEPPVGKTRGSVMRDGVLFLKEVTKGAKILGCGVPLGSAAGVFDYCRIGPDAALIWEDKLLKFLNYRERVSTAATLRNTVTRSIIDGIFFGNDPDVFILRNENNSLSRDQKDTLFIVNLLFGSLVFTSDNIKNYDERMKQLYKFHLLIKDKQVRLVDYRENIATAEVVLNNGPLYIFYINLSLDKEFSIDDRLRIPAGSTMIFKADVTGTSVDLLSFTELLYI